MKNSILNASYVLYEKYYNKFDLSIQIFLELPNFLKLLLYLKNKK